ncbi:exosortase N [Emticicia soli]|uniref:Exosortase N n=1 Tax=Emticicia soli TaxID=2027878 RepID=A0ABW5JBF4_9BACT
MTKTLSHDTSKAGLIIAYIILFINISYKGYFLSDTTFWLGLGVLAYVLKVGTLTERSMRFFAPTLLLALVSFYIPTFSIRYLLLVIALLFCVESLFGKISELAFISLLLMSPLFRYISETFTFPIRIWLSEISGHLLTRLHFPVEVKGNLILLNGDDFLVDAACTGLQMLGVSFLLTVFLLAYYQAVFQKKIGFGWQLASLAITFLLNIVSNLCRILLLIIFKIPPENFLHDLMGICCLLAYVWLPMAWLIKQITPKQKAALIKADIQVSGI